MNRIENYNFSLILDRGRNDCRICEPGKSGRLVCTNHSNFYDVNRTSLVDFSICVGHSMNVRQEIHTAVLCLISEDCTKVRKLLFFLFFVARVLNFCCTGPQLLINREFSNLRYICRQNASHAEVFLSTIKP